MAAALSAELVLHFDNLQELASRVASSVAYRWRDAARNNVSHEGGHESSEVRTSFDTAFGDRKTLGLPFRNPNLR